MFESFQFLLFDSQGATAIQRELSRTPFGKRVSLLGRLLVGPESLSRNGRGNGECRDQTRHECHRDAGMDHEIPTFLPDELLRRRGGSKLVP